VNIYNIQYYKVI